MKNDEGKLRSIRYKVEQDSEVLDRIVESIVSKYSQQLDSEVDKIKQLLERPDDLTDNEVENIVMRLPVFMYYAVNGLEDLGIESDIAKAVKLEVFNENYIRVDGTIKDKTHQAELNTMDEQMIEVAYSRAYRKLKSKIDQAENIFSGVKKVLTKRMQDQEMHRQDRFN